MSNQALKILQLDIQKAFQQYNIEKFWKYW